jgi:hypothetical protein
MVYEVQVLEEVTTGINWKPAGPDVNVSGDDPGQAAVAEVAKFTGWYRTRPKAEPESPWAFYNVSAHPRTGQPVVKFSEDPPPP